MATPIKPERSAKLKAQWRRVVDDPWIVALTLFLVTLFLGLPLLWMSRAYSFGWKVGLTVATLVWTVIVFWAFFWLMAWCYHRIITNI